MYKRQGYNDIAEIYTRFSVDHSKKQFVDGDIYTNTIEGFWSILKRGIIGIYHHMSKKHLQLYADVYKRQLVKEVDLSYFSAMLKRN